MKTKTNANNRAGFRLEILSAFIMLLVQTGCGSNDANSDTGATAISGQRSTEKPAAAIEPQARFFYQVELEKQKYLEIIKEIKGESNKEKLILQLSCPDISDPKGFFDLVIYGAKNHKNYADGKTPFLAKAVAPHLPIEAGKRYDLGNNEVLVNKLNELVKSPLVWTKLVFFPDTNAKRQLYYKVVPYNGDSPAILPGEEGFGTTIRSLSTNPSPPAKPLGN